jgi:hypothetical protein
LQFASPRIHVAAFLHDWQVLTIYGLYLVPLSILLRKRPWHTQYAYAVAAIAPIDVVGFAIGTSIVYPGNFIEHLFGPQSFTLVFVLGAAWIPLAGNFVVSRLEAFLFERPDAGSMRARSFRGEVLPLASLEAGARNADGPLPTAWQ